MPSSTTVSRRDFFHCLLGRRNRDARSSIDSHETNVPQVAIIQGRYCLAYQRSFCSTCSEQCPEPNAIIVEQGIPRISADACTGCGICHQRCPAPTNAILMTQRPTTLLTEQS